MGYPLLKIFNLQVGQTYVKDGLGIPDLAVCIGLNQIFFLSGFSFHFCESVK